MKYIVLYLFLFILSSCVSNKNKVLFGEYESKKYNAFQQLNTDNLEALAIGIGERHLIRDMLLVVLFPCESSIKLHWLYQRQTL
jgi:hypothetical protein